jgi:hypothetical protein
MFEEEYMGVPKTDQQKRPEHHGNVAADLKTRLILPTLV